MTNRELETLRQYFKVNHFWHKEPTAYRLYIRTKYLDVLLNSLISAIIKN